MQQLRKSNLDLGSLYLPSEDHFIPDAPTQKCVVLESICSEAGPENILGAGRAMLSMAYGKGRDSVLHRAASMVKQQAGILACSPFTADTQVVALEINHRVLSFSLKHTGDVANYPKLEEDYVACGAHCSGREFAAFLWRYQQVIQHDLLLLGYAVSFEKGTASSEEVQSGVFCVHISYIHPPSPNQG